MQRKFLIVLFGLFIGFNAIADPVLYKFSSYLDTAFVLKTIEQLNEEDHLFTPESDAKQIGFGFTNYPLWLKIKQNGSSTEKQILSIDYPLLDSVQCFYQNNEGQWNSILIGDKVKGWDRKYQATNLFMDLPIARSGLYYLRIKSESSLTVPLRIQTLENFYFNNSTDQIFYFLYYGFLLVMLIYNFFLYYSLKSKTYLIYCFSILFTLAYQTVNNGHAQFYLWGDNIVWSNLSMPFFMGLTTLFAAEFTVAFLNFETKSIRSYLARFISLLGLITVMLAVFSNYGIAIKLASISAMFGVVVLLSLGIFSWVRKEKVASYYTIAYLVYFAFLFVGVLRAFGVIPSNFFTYKCAHFGSALELLILAFALAYKYKQINKEKLEMQEQLYSIEHELNMQLEERVQQRTNELEVALKDKGIMMSEIHHRVKNNLQLVTSMLNLHIRKLEDQNSKEALRDSKRRIEVMAELHEQLYSEDSDLVNLEFNQYLSRFINLIKAGYTDKKIDINFSNELELSLSFDKMILLALVLNEIINNSIKHGYKNKKEGVIHVSLTKEENQLVVEIGDNGAGLPEQFSVEKSGSLGLRIITTLTKQLKGDYQIANNKIAQGVNNIVRIGI